jgi:hypothetical protein
MGFYRKNIGGVHQVVRIILGLAGAAAALVFLSGLAQWLLAASGLAFALTGCIGYAQCVRSLVSAEVTDREYGDDYQRTVRGGLPRRSERNRQSA